MLNSFVSAVRAVVNADRNRRYVYGMIGAEISATTRFCDEVIQAEPLPHEDGLLLSLIECPRKSPTTGVEGPLPGAAALAQRKAFLLNGNLNASDDIQLLLERIHGRMGRGDRLFVVLYTPYAQWLFRLITWLGLRKGALPATFVTETDLRSLMKLANFEIVRIRQSVCFPVFLPVISWLINLLLPAIPLIRRIALTWVVVARPLKMRMPVIPSLSIVIPARNERGNLESAILRLPEFATKDVEIIFVEGHSSDGTWEEIQRLQRKYAAHCKIKALQQSGKGKCDAVRLGFSCASGDLLTILDADLTMPPELLLRFYDAWRIGCADFVNGNRLVYPMQGSAMQRLNLLGNRFFAKALSYVLGVSLGDSLCGTKLLARRDYERLVMWRNWFGDFDPFGDFELLFAASELALGTVDLPIAYKARTYGSTSISRFRDGWLLLRMTLYGLVRLRVGRMK